MTKLPLAILDAHGIRAKAQRPSTSLGFAGRSELLALWRQLDAEQQAKVLEVVRGMVANERG